MEILYLLVPISVALVLVIIGLFGWAVFSGQFDHLDGEGARIAVKDAAAMITCRIIAGNGGIGNGDSVGVALIIINATAKARCGIS